MGSHRSGSKAPTERTGRRGAVILAELGRFSLGLGVSTPRQKSSKLPIYASFCCYLPEKSLFWISALANFPRFPGQRGPWSLPISLTHRRVSSECSCLSPDCAL